MVWYYNNDSANLLDDIRTKVHVIKGTEQTSSLRFQFTMQTNAKAFSVLTKTIDGGSPVTMRSNHSSKQDNVEVVSVVTKTFDGGSGVSMRNKHSSKQYNMFDPFSYYSCQVRRMNRLIGGEGDDASQSIIDAESLSSNNSQAARMTRLSWELHPSLMR
jgi:hypothetical protein